MSEPIEPRWPAESLGEAPGRERLPGRRILVVGGGQRAIEADDDPVGNGRAICRLFAREGAAVAVADRDLSAAQETAELAAREGGSAMAIAADVAKPADIERMVDEAAAGLNGLDGVVLNVGIGGTLGIENTSVEEWDTIHNVNLRGHMLTAKAALPVLADGGAFVFISSIAAYKPMSRMVTYDTSKIALEALSRHVALTGEPRLIRSNVVAPGLIDTPLGRWASAGRPSRTKLRLPLGRQGTGWEVAYAALFLISDEAAYVNAQVLVADGGMTQIR